MSLCAVPYDMIFIHFSQKEKKRAKKKLSINFLPHVRIVEVCVFYTTKFECNNYIPGGILSYKNDRSAHRKF